MSENNCNICGQEVEYDEEGNIVESPECDNTECPNQIGNIHRDEKPLNFHRFEDPQLPTNENYNTFEDDE